MVTSVLSDDQLGAVHLLLDRIRARQLQDFGQIGSDAVSYTHLTLPTILLV